MLTIMSNLDYSTSQISEAKKCLGEIEKSWRKVEKKVVKEIEKISKLKFKEGVTCFLVKNMGYNALSHPLTIKMNSDYDKFNDVLLHEMIHLILIQSSESKELLYSLNRLYQKKDRSFIAHLPLLLIERRVVENLFGDKHYKNILKEDREIEGLKEVWEETNRLYDNFKNSKSGIVKFFEDELANK
jgi:hypothetical protein|tara:strand:- start:136 stop:693 length:558 start_codon:yes stop_codon:yes gene_type:complete